LEEVNKCSQATDRANNSWHGWRVSGDEVTGEQEPGFPAMTVCFLLHMQKASEKFEVGEWSGEKV
jgi:hypothetical protein